MGTSNGVKLYGWSFERLVYDSDDYICRFDQLVNDWQLTPNVLGWCRTAEVTLGDLDTKELLSKQWKPIVPVLYFIGEFVAVAGHFGGYNFKWACQQVLRPGSMLDIMLYIFLNKPQCVLLRPRQKRAWSDLRFTFKGKQPKSTLCVDRPTRQKILI